MTLHRFAASVLLALAVIQAAWISVMPPFRGIDEIDHVYRATAVGHGEWFAGQYADEGRGRLVSVPPSMVVAAHAQCEDLPYMREENCSPAGPVQDGLVQVASAAASYQPLTYAALGWVTNFLSGSDAVIGMRIATGVLCLIFLGAGAMCLFLAGAGSTASLVILLVLSPVTLYSTTVVAPNGVEMASAFSLWCALLALGAVERIAHERVVVLAAGVSAVVLAGTRTLGPAFVAAIIIFAISFGWRNKAWLSREAKYLWAFGAMVFIAGLSQISWYRTQNMPDLRVNYDSGSGFVSADASWMLTNFLLWPLQMIAAFPFRDQAAPAVVYVVFVLLFSGLLVVAIKRASVRHRVTLTLLALSTLALPFVLTWLTYSSRGVIWQGRYGLPLAFGVPLMACLLVRRWRHCASKKVLIPLFLMIAVMHVAGMLKVLRDESDRQASLLHSGWHPPSIWVLLLLVGAACGILGYTAYRLEVPDASTDLDPVAGASGHRP